MKSLGRMFHYWWQYQKSNLCCRNRNASFIAAEVEDVVEIEGKRRWRGKLTMECANCGKQNTINDILLPETPSVPVKWNKRLAREIEECL